jgi:Transmembrane family 220, helix
MIRFNYAFAGIYLLFALLQINDPDPYLWIPIYGVVALTCFLNARGKFDALSHWGIIAFSAIYAAKLIIETDGVIDWMNKYGAESLVQSMKATKPWIENAREFGGLLIILTTTTLNLIVIPRVGKK